MLFSLFRISSWFCCKFNFILNIRNSIPGFGFTEPYKTCCQFETPGIFGAPSFDCGACSFKENVLQISSPYIKEALYEICPKSKSDLEKKIALLKPLISPRVKLKNIAINKLYELEEKRKSLVSDQGYYRNDEEKGIIAITENEIGNSAYKKEDKHKKECNLDELKENGPGNNKITLNEYFLVNEDNTKVYCIVLNNWLYPIASSFVSLNEKPDYPLIIAWQFKCLLCRPFFEDYIICRNQDLLAVFLDFEQLLSKDFCIKQVDISKFYYEPKEKTFDFRTDFLAKQKDEEDNEDPSWISIRCKAILNVFCACLESLIYVLSVTCMTILTISLNRSLVLKRNLSQS